MSKSGAGAGAPKRRFSFKKPSLPQAEAGAGAANETPTFLSEPINNENLNIIRTFKQTANKMTRKGYPGAGAFGRPDFLGQQMGPFMRNPHLIRITNKTIRTAVNMWCDPDTHEQAEDKYGDIRYWNVSSVTNMRDLFYNKPTFNDDISRWNVSAVTNMQSMFDSAAAFNQNIGKWDVSAVTNMDAMFNYASAFNQNLNRWNVSNVRDMRLMFFSAVSFNGNISGWNVGNVSNMEAMFSQAESFERNISGWDVENVTNMEGIFEDCPIPENNKPQSMRLGGGGSARKKRRTGTRKRRFHGRRQ